MIKEYLVVGYYDDGQKRNEMSRIFYDLDEVKLFCQSYNQEIDSMRRRWEFRVFEINRIARVDKVGVWTDINKEL